MDNRYSPSKLNSFNGCKLKYKYQYIDNLESDLTTIENFLGSRVHEVLENLYRLIKNGRVESLDWLLKGYEDVWKKNFNEGIKVVRKELMADDYFEKGRQYLIDYYNKYHPFNQAKIVDIEYHVNFELEDGESKYLIHGYVDRLDWDDKNNLFEIHDYKTSGKLMTQEEADNDWQLGFYHLALKKKWPDAEKIKLIWHALPFNREIVSYRTKDQMDGLQKAIIEKVKEVELRSDFPPEKSAICDWCDFQNICPLWKHPKEMEKVSVNEYKKDPGVKLVTAYKELNEKKNELQEEIKNIETEQVKIEEAAVEFAKKNNISIIDGPDARLKVDIKEELRPPAKAEDEERWWALRELLIKEGKFQDVSTINPRMMEFQIKKWPKDFINKISSFLIHKTIESVRLIKKY